MADKKVAIPKDVYEGIAERVKVTEFKSVDDYVTYVLRQVLEQIKDDEKPAYSKEDEEMVKARLRSLGYLD